MSQVITNAFEQYWQSSLAAEQPVVLDEFILANIPNLDITSPINPDTGLPPESQIVHRQNVDQRGRINNNAVAYTIVMDTTVGDFSFNAMYLRNKQNGVIGMIVYKGRETKLKTDQTTGQTGNSLVKSMLMGYDQAAEATLTHVDAGTWQIDYAARLRGIDEDIRQLQADLYGHHTFVGDGFKVVEKDGAYQVSQGVAIVGGLRIELKAPEIIHPGSKPIGVWVDVHRTGSLLSEHQNHFTIITSVADLADHVDSNGYQHFVAKLATVLADGTIEDARGCLRSGEESICESVDELKKSGKTSIVNIFESQRRSYAEAGLNLVEGSFEEGGRLVNENDVLIHWGSGKAYSGVSGDVQSGTDPELGGFIDMSGVYGRDVVVSTPEFDKSVSHRFILNGTPYVYDNSVRGLPDGPNFIDGKYCFVVGGDAFKKVYADRGVYHINQLGHVFGSDASEFIKCASYFASQVEITGWEVVLDGGFELSIPVYGKGTIKQFDGDEGIVIVTGGGLYGGPVVDCANSDKKRPLSFKKGAISPFIDNAKVVNVRSSTFVFALFVENAGVVDFKVRRFVAENLHADGSGVEGDAVGVCRGISVSSSSSLLPSDVVSNGDIEFISAKNFTDWEDCDAVAIQCVDSDGVTRDADITVKHVKTRNVLKRAVKVQANGVGVQDVDAISTNEKPMYSVVSYYGKNGVVRCVRGKGVNNGVDVLGYATINDVDVSSDVTYEPGAAIQITGGSCVSSGIRSNGLRHVIFVNAVLGNVTSASFSNVKGTSDLESVYLKSKFDIGLVDINSGSELKCIDATRYVIAEDLSAPGSIGTLNLANLKMTNEHFFSLFLQKTGKLIATDVLCGGGAVGGLKVLGGSAELGGIYSDKELTVELEGTKGARAVNIKGKLRLRNTVDTRAALYDSIEEIGTNSGLKKTSW